MVFGVSVRCVVLVLVFGVMVLAFCSPQLPVLPAT